MSSFNCCFLTCIQISQEADQVVWYSHLVQNFPQFVVIHTVKGFGVVSKAEVDVFLELSWFFLWSNRCWQFDFWFLMLPEAILVCFPGGLSRRESAFQCRTCRVYLWIEKIPCWRKWQRTVVFLQGESHGQKSLVGCSPQGCEELDTTECWAQALKVHLTLYSRMSGSRWMTTPGYLGH